MSQLDIKIRKLQDNGSTFRANIETLYLGGVRSAKVDELRFELPEEWKNCTVTLHVQRLSGTKPDPQILDENNSALVDRRWTLEKRAPGCCWPSTTAATCHDQARQVHLL